MRDQFISAFSRMATSVAVITTDGPGGQAGATISSFCSVSADPPTLLACVIKSSPMAAAIQENGTFCLNLLSREQTRASNVFAGRIKSPSDNKFDLVDWCPSELGQPQIDGSLTSFDCQLQGKMDGSSHEVFVAKVKSVVNTQNETESLVYCKQDYASASNLENSHLGLNKFIMETL